MKFAFVLLVAVPGASFAGNFATCILDNMPAVQNQAAHSAVLKMCKDMYGGELETVEQGSGRGFLSFKSGAECAAKKAADTRFQGAGVAIYSACRKLYDQHGFIPIDR